MPQNFWKNGEMFGTDGKGGGKWGARGSGDSRVIGEQIAMNDVRQAELLRLMSGLCDGQLGTEEAERLEALLRDEDARRVYLEYMDMQARLVGLGDEAVMGEKFSIAARGAAAMVGREHELQPASLGMARNRWATGSLRRVASYIAVVSASIAATVMVQWLLPVTKNMQERNAVVAGAVSPAKAMPEPKYVATLTQVSDAQWGGATPVYRAGARVLGGDFELRRGVARLAYDGGIELIVEAPARLRLESETVASLVTGKVVFRADDASAPFTLNTPTSVLVDLGTEYAVEVGAEREEVHVFSGEVQRVAIDGGEVQQPQLLLAGEARRFSSEVDSEGVAEILAPEKFVRELPTAQASAGDTARELLARESFDYSNANALREETADGGEGFRGPWGGGLARAPNERLDVEIALNTSASLKREATPETSVGGAFEHVGFAKYFRRLATPVRLDADGMYYFSYLLRRDGPPLDPLADVSIQLRQTEELQSDQRDATIDLRKRLNFGVDRTNELNTHLERVGRRMPLPLSYGETYLLVAKVAASGAYPDQVFLRIYGPQEPVDRLEPTTWSAVGAPVQSDLVFDWLEVHINSHTRQAIDEIRIGTSWGAVTGPWVGQ